MPHSCFIHSSIDGHLGCFYTLVIVNDTTMEIGVLMIFWISVLGSFGYISRSGIAGWKGRSISNFLRSLHIAFHSGCTSLYSQQQCKSVSLSPHPHHHLLFFDLLIIAILTGILLWFLFTFLWWLVTLNIFLYVYWPSICPLWRNVYSGPLPIFNWGLFVFFLLSFVSSS